MKIYNVLWLDDEQEEFQPIKDLAAEQFVKLIGVSNAKDGIEELERNFNTYDAVILDGKFFTDASQEGSDVGNTAFGMVAKKLDEWKTQGKLLPWFIYSGQPEFVKESNETLDLFRSSAYADGRVFDKNNDEDFDDLLTEIKREADNNPLTKLKHQYHEVFKICDEGCLGLKIQDQLLEIIQSLEHPDNDFTKLRKVYESLFKRLSELAILPEKFTEERGWISGASAFLSERHSDYEFLHSSFIHPLIANSLFRSLLIMQDASHAEGTLKLKVSQFLKDQNTGYTYKSTVFSFLEVLAYMARVIKDNQNPAINRQRWKVIEKDKEECVEGVIERDSLGHYHVGDILLGYHLIHGQYPVGTKVIVYNPSKNVNDKTNAIYPRFGSKFSVIEE